MGVKKYLNRILNEDSEIKNIDFQKEFMTVGLSVEKEITEDDVDPNELEMGIEVEVDKHTTNEEVAKKLAIDNLAKIPDYYTRLAKMEDDAFAEMGESEKLEEKRKKRKKKRKKKSLKRGFIGGYAYYGQSDGDFSGGDAGGDGGDAGSE